MSLFEGYAGIAPRSRFFYACSMIGGIVVGLVFVALPLALPDRFHGSAKAIGLTVAARGIAYAGLTMWAGRMADRFGPKRMLTLGCAAHAIFALISATTHSCFLFECAYAAGGASFSLFWPSLQAWLSTGRGRVSLMRSVTIYTIASAVGVMIGSVLSGFLYEFLSPSAPFAVAAVLSLAPPLVLRCVTSPESGNEDPEEIETHDLPPHWRSYRTAAWTAGFAGTFAAMAVQTFFPGQARACGLSPTEIGALLASARLFHTAAMLFLGRTTCWQYRLWPLWSSEILSVLGLLILTQASNTIEFLPALATIWFCSGITYGVSAFSSLYGSADKGRKSGINESVTSGGAFVAPAAGGYLLVWLGQNAPWGLCVGMFFVMMAVQWRLIRSKAPGV